MRVLFTSTRGAGHLQPLLPYLHTLKQRGHDVCVAAPESVSEKLQKNNLPHAPFDHPGDELLKPIWARFKELSPDEVITVTIREIFAGINVRYALPKLQETIQRWSPDLIVRESAEMAAIIAAERAGIPHARIAVSNGYMEEDLASRAYDSIDSLRQEIGLDQDNGESLRTEPVFTSFPSSLDGDVKSSGQSPFRVGGPTNAPIPERLDAEWIPKRGEQLVYITFGTIAASESDRHVVYQNALSSVEQLPVRALLTTGPDMEASTLDPIPDNVTVESWVPQDKVLPYASALVCHGGSGTVLGGLAAGVPMVVIPMFADQPDNARRIEDAGAGVAVFDSDVVAIRAAIERVLTDTEMHETTKKIAKEIASTANFSDAIDTLLSLAKT